MKVRILIILCLALGALLNFPLILIFIPFNFENVLVVNKVKVFCINLKKRLCLFKFFNSFDIKLASNIAEFFRIPHKNKMLIPFLKKELFSYFLSFIKFFFKICLFVFCILFYIL